MKRRRLFNLLAHFLVALVFVAALTLILQLIVWSDSYADPGRWLEAASVQSRPPYWFVGMVEGVWLIVHFDGDGNGPTREVLRLNCAWTLAPNVIVLAGAAVLPVRLAWTSRRWKSGICSF